jgi:hypothetical protein
MTDGKKGKAPKKAVDWAAVEKDYRAGILTLRQMADAHGVSHVSIKKHADRHEWSRDLKAQIVAKAEEKVNRAQVNSEVNKDRAVSEKVIVEANAEILAQADLINRKDVLLALSVSRSQLKEVAELGNPEFREMLAAVGEMMDETYVNDRGVEIKDKVNELYRYIISLAGRVKMSKEIAAAHGVYIPMQRKILKLDEDADKGQAQLDQLLAKINASS